MQELATCGLAVPRRNYWQFGCFLLHEDKPVFVIGSQGPLTRSRPALAERGFNALLSYADDAPPPSSWTKRSCQGQHRPDERTCL